MQPTGSAALGVIAAILAVYVVRDSLGRRADCPCAIMSPSRSRAAYLQGVKPNSPEGDAF